MPETRDTDLLMEVAERGALWQPLHFVLLLLGRREVGALV